MNPVVFLYGGALTLIALYAFNVKDTVAEEELALSSDFTLYDDLFQRYGGANGVPWQWLKAIAMNESRLGQDPSVALGIISPDDIEGSKSSDGKSWGLMQMTLPTARDFEATATSSRLNNPEYSVKLAAKFVRSLMNQWNSNDARFEEFVIKSYNQGASRTISEFTANGPAYADDYWDRYQRNRSVIRTKQGE